MFPPRRLAAAIALIGATSLACPALAQAPRESPPAAPVERPFDVYVAYALRVESVERGPDRHWQALVTVRNLQATRASLSSGHLALRLRNASGEEIRNWGELYRASVTGPVSKLDKLVDTVIINPGEEAKVRLAFFNSARFTPVSFRMENVMESSFKDHSMRELPALGPADPTRPRSARTLAKSRP
jgi:hypothetical protein